MKSTQAIAKYAHPAETDTQQGGNGFGDSESKSVLLAELMKQPGTYDAFGSAWRLAMWLLLSNDGRFVGSYRDIAALLGDVSADSAKNWARDLEGKGVVSISRKGNQITLTLTDNYMRVATAPSMGTSLVEVMPPNYETFLAVESILKGASKLGGKVKLSLENCELGYGHAR